VISAVTAKLIGVGLAALLLIGVVADLKRWERRAHTAEAQAIADCTATRAASGVTRLRCDQTDEQIRFLGEALNSVAAKTAEAQQSDANNKARVEGEQNTISQERGSSYETRIADARARANSLRSSTGRTANSSGSGKPSVSGLPSTSGIVAQIAEQDRFSLADRLTATEQAIQLDELIKWTKAQHAVDVNANPPPAPKPAPKKKRKLWPF
jgi:hypothetical protein